MRIRFDSLALDYSYGPEEPPVIKIDLTNISIYNSIENEVLS